MWMTNIVTGNFQNQYRITNKFADYKGNIDIELFTSELFQQLALVTYKDNAQNIIYQEVMTQRFHYIESEVIAHIPYCVINECKRALICGTLNAEIAHFLSFYNIAVDMVVSDKEALHTLSGFLPNFKSITQNPLITLVDNFMSLSHRDYDIIIHLGNPKQHEFEALTKLANKSFIMIFRLHNLYLEPSLALNTLYIAKDFGHILMPFMISALTSNFYAFLSNRYHPLADLQLQKSDMLENMQFYNSHIHTSVFRLPSILTHITSSYVKN